MNALRRIETELQRIGYRGDFVVPDYSFADVMSPAGELRRVALAAFTQTPPSYRYAALGVMEVADPESAAAAVMAHRALGAPVMLSITGDQVTAWQVHPADPPRRIGRHPLQHINALFDEYAERWSPAALHRVKAIGQQASPYQFDFVDMGLIPAIEGEIHAKLDHLLRDAMAEMIKDQGVFDGPTLVKLTFRLLAGKILADREHQIAANCELDDAVQILDAIARHYSFTDILPHRAPGVSRAWHLLRSGINVRHIAADDLAFVYEHTLVTQETRDRFDTHSTPRQMAEHIVSVIDPSLWSNEGLRVYEPFSGGGVFLVSALRHIRDRLNREWTPEHRHAYLTNALSGAEFDAFACEAATLSLILADYPNRNGWNIRNLDLFKPDLLADGARDATVILCNPPFKDFTEEERLAYPAMAARSIHKPIAALETILDCPPQALGFVLPGSFRLGKHYAGVRRRLESLYSAVELVALPDRVFNVSTVDATLLIAQERREDSRYGSMKLKSVTVSERDRTLFLERGKVTSVRCREKPANEQAIGSLWVEELSEVWDYLADYPTLGTVCNVHRGIEWKYDQSDAGSPAPLPGYRRGVRTIGESLKQFCVGKTEWLDCREESLLWKAINLPWSEPKVIANAVRMSRGPWRLSAVADHEGLVASQQFFGIWILANSEWNPFALSSLINGPVANAYITIHSPGKGIRVGALTSTPIPRDLDMARMRTLVSAYSEALRSTQLLDRQSRAEELSGLLMAIDAAILYGYDLPPRLERMLLEYFRDQQRPVAHDFSHWLPAELTACIPLHEYLDPEMTKIRRDWVTELFGPLPKEEVDAMEIFLE